MKKILTGVCLLLAGLAMQAQSGLQGIIVEKYYVSNTNDSIVSAAQGGGNLRVGSVTWRFYADLLPNYKLQAVYGVDVAPTGTISTGDHELRLETSTKFFNNEDRGAVTPTYSKANTASNSVMLDSWFSMGNGCAGYYGVPKSVDNGVSTTANVNGMLLNSDPLAGDLTSQDGLLTGSGAAQAVTLVPSTLGVSVFNATSQAGSLFSTYNGSWASLNGSSGPDTSNKVLIAQMTTNGTLTYAFNLQVGTPSGGVQRFVAANPVGNEIYNSTLSGTLYPFAGCSCAAPAVPTTPMLLASSGVAKVCPGDVRKYTVTRVGCTLHVWTAPAGATITAGQNTDTVTITYGAGFTANGTLSVVAQNACGTSSVAKTLAITRNVPATPGVITGPSSVVCTGSSHNYSVVNVSGITYNWSGTSGIGISSGQGSNSIAAAFTGFTSGTLSVTAQNTCATSAARTLAITSVPAATTGITVTGGAAKVCNGDTRTYSVTNVAGVTYTWTVPTGATINIGQGSNSISVTYGPGFVADGTIGVTPSNACGNGPLKTLAIARNILAAPATLTGTTYDLCGATSVTYTAGAVTGASSYAWSTTVGSFNPVSTSTTASIDYPSSNFTASVKVGAVNGCGTGALKTLATYAKPAVPVITGNATVCNNALETYNATAGASSYVWTIPTGATFVGPSNTASITVQFGTIPVSPKIIVKNYNNCTYNTKTLTLVWGSCKTDELAAGIEVEKEMGISNLNVFPNPSNGAFNISFNSEKDGEQMNIRVFDVAGKLVKEVNELSHSPGATNVAVDLSSEASGVYVMSLQTQGITKRVRLVKD